LTVLASLCVAAGVAFGSALVPLISVEIFVLALVAKEPWLPWPLLGAVVAVSQVVGKLFYYLAARGTLHLPAFMHRKPKPLTARRERWHQRTKMIRARVERLTEKCHRHPHWMAGTYGVSAVIGLPPFMATTVLAGLARMSIATFLTAGLTGRFIRFSLLAASPALLSGWLF
jgi:membrane protein YqaA with SNARE-associated domain